MKTQAGKKEQNFEKIYKVHDQSRNLGSLVSFSSTAFSLLIRALCQYTHFVLGE